MDKERFPYPLLLSSFLFVLIESISTITMWYVNCHVFYPTKTAVTFSIQLKLLLHGIPTATFSTELIYVLFR